MEENAKPKANQGYKIREGTTNKGKDYEVSIASLCSVLILQEETEEAWIATNAAGCGDFDDVVVYWKTKDSSISTENLIMVQSKHSDKPTKLSSANFIKDSTRSKKDFSLEKHVSKYFLNIDSNLVDAANNIVSETVSRLKDTTQCILFTNNDIDNDELDIMNKQKNDKCLLRTLNTNGKLHGFKSKTLGSTVANIILKNVIYELILQVLRKLFTSTTEGKLKRSIKREKLDRKLCEAKPFDKTPFPVSEDVKKYWSNIIADKTHDLISELKLDDVAEAKDLNELILKEQLNFSTQETISRHITKDEIITLVSKNIDVTLDFIDNRLFLMSNQKNTEEMHDIIVNEITNILQRNDIKCSDINEIVTKYKLFISDWAQGKLGDNYILRKSHIIGKFEELLLKDHVVHFPFIKQTNFSTDGIRKWTTAIEDKSITFVDTTYDNTDEHIINFLYCYVRNELNKFSKNEFSKIDWSQHFTAAKKDAFHKIDDILLREEISRVIGSEGALSLCNVYIALWKLQRVPLVLKASTSEKCSHIVNVLKWSNFNVKVIVVGEFQQEFLDEAEVPGSFANLTDLSEESIREITEETVQLQGRKIQVKELTDMDKNIPQLITSRAIIHILTKNEDFTIGAKFNALPKVFIRRSVSKVLLDFKKFINSISTSKSVYVVKCENKKFFFDCLEKCNLNMDQSQVNEVDSIGNNAGAKECKIIIVRDLGIRESFIEKLFGGTPTHYLTLDSDCNVEWLKTVGKVEDIRSCLLDVQLHKSKSVQAADAVNYFSRQINVISASPGMGKTTIMDYIALNASTNKWILRINLKDHSDYYNSEEHQELSDADQHLTYFNNKQYSYKQSTPLDNEIFKHFLQKKSILILLDGFDEISPAYKRQVTKTINSMFLANYRVWITTRPVLKLHVEKEFNTIAVTLIPLTKEDQHQFLVEYLSEELRTKEIDKICNFVDKLLDFAKDKLNDGSQEFTSVPLQTMLLADLFTEKCKLFLDNPSLSLDDDINLLDLYEKFVEKQVQTLVDKYQDFAKQLATSFEKYQELFALKVVFSDEDLQELGINEQLESCSKAFNNIEELVQKDGIIVTIDGARLTFAHRTFAEYFIAKWLAGNVDNPVVRKNLIEKLFGEAYNTIRNLFDHILARDCPLHTLILNRQFKRANDLVETNSAILNKRDRGGRLAVHLLAAWGTRHPMPKEDEYANSNVHKVKDGKDATLSILKHMCRDSDLSSKDTLFELTPLEYAAAADCLASMDAIISVYEESGSINFSNKKIRSYLYYCARYGYNSLGKEVISNIIHFPVQVRENLNATAHHRNWKVWNVFGSIAQFVLKLLPRSNKLPNFIHVNSHINTTSGTALHVAAAFAQKEVLTSVLAAGASVNARTPSLFTPLHYAVQKGSDGCLDVISVLLANGADIHAQEEYQRTALHYAVKNCTADVVSLLLSNGANIHAQDKDLRTPLQHAAKNNALVNTRFLLDNGANVEDKDIDKRTPLINAAKNNYLEMAQLLISKGADVDAGDFRNVSALFHAECRGYFAVVDILKANGARTDMVDDFGQTVLDYSNMYDKGPRNKLD